MPFKSDEQKAAYFRNRYIQNKERILARSAAFHRENPEKVRAYKAKWAAANAEKISQKNAAYRAANAEKCKSDVAAWARKNKEARKTNEQRRRAAKAGSSGRLSRGLAGKLFSLQGGKCPCCAMPLGDDYHMDHIIPLALGGSNADENMQLLRKTCNLQKNAKHPVDFMQSRGFLL